MRAVLLAAAGCAAARSGAEHDAARQRVIDQINAKQSLWTAGHNPRFRGQPVGAMKPLLGTRVADNMAKLAAMVKSGDMDFVAAATRDIPADFDSATAFPKCAKMINDIRDQSNCGCCWAFGSAEAASDRLCTQTNGTVILPLSAQDLCFCPKSNGYNDANGCGGGYPMDAWGYIVSHGLVTGSQQQPDDGKTDPFAGKGYCSSFSLPHCHHHGPTGSDPYPAEGAKGCATKYTKQTQPKCPTKCDTSAKAPHDSFAGDKIKVTRVTGYTSADAIAQALMESGPVTASFTVYSDFENYAGGIYKPTVSKMDGGHAVKFVGFGTDAATGTKYWKMANSWNPYWGENGFFRIVRGDNTCGIEAGAVSSAKDAEWLLPGQTAAPTPPGSNVCAFKHDCRKCSTYCNNSNRCTATECKCPKNPRMNCVFPKE